MSAMLIIPIVVFAGVLIFRHIKREVQGECGPCVHCLSRQTCQNREDENISPQRREDAK